MHQPDKNPEKVKPLAMTFKPVCSYPGLVMNASMLTVAVASSLLLAYKANIIEVNNQFRNMVSLSVGGIFMTYMASFMLRFVGVNMSFLHTGTTGLIITAVVAAIAAASLLREFDTLQQMEMRRMPQWMEWYGAYSVLVSLAWLYFEIARLMSMGRKREA